MWRQVALDSITTLPNISVSSDCPSSFSFKLKTDEMNESLREPLMPFQFFRRHLRRIMVGLILFTIAWVVMTVMFVSIVLLPYQREKRIARQTEAVGGKVETFYCGPLWIMAMPFGWDSTPLFDRIVSIRFTNAGQAVTSNLLAEIGSLKRLEWLDLGNTQVSDTELKHFKGLTSLYELDLNGTQVSNIGLEHLKGMTNLKALTLGRTNVTDLEHLKHLNGLIRLSLKGTKVTDAGLKYLNCPGNLDLSGTQVTDTGLEHLKGQTQLVTLILSGTTITDTGVEHLDGLTNLVTLDLVATQVTDTGLEHLKGLKTLNRLCLNSTQTTPNGRAMLRLALPSCNIEPNP